MKIQHYLAFFTIVSINSFSIAYFRNFKVVNHAIISTNSFTTSIPNVLAVTGSATSGSLNVVGVSLRIQRIKDISLLKRILNDLTAAEFALKVENKYNETKIDYEMLISNLDRCMDILNKKHLGENDDLPGRLQRTRQELRTLLESSKSITSSNAATGYQFQNPETATIKSAIDNLPSLRVFLREDGTVDWEETIASGKEVAKYGTELWQRLNGKEEKDTAISLNELFGQKTAKLPTTPEMERLTDEVETSRKLLEVAVGRRNEDRIYLRKAREVGMNITASDLNRLRSHDGRVKELEKRLQLCGLNLDMERICVYLEGELQTSITPPSDQRILVAEVALLDKQLTALMAGLTPVGPAMRVSLLQNSSTEARVVPEEDRAIGYRVQEEDDDLVSLIDDDELALVAAEVADLKNRLGLESQGKAVDWGTLGVLVSDSLNKIRDGLRFYSLGTRILVNDIQYAWQLLLKATQGYTLQAREVNSVRRTGKDLLTLIPFTIILIIPLSPIGHVLVFSFIQRYFPDFFPSCYTEKRQNLRQLYADIERKSDDELLGPRGEVEQKEAGGFFFFNKS